MIQEDAIEAYNRRLTVNIGDLATLSASRQDAVKAHGSKAEALLRNPDLAMFIHQFRFETTDTLAGIAGHDQDSNARRVALSNHLAGIDAFVASLQRAVYMKNRVVRAQENPGTQDNMRDPLREVYTP